MGPCLSFVLKDKCVDTRQERLVHLLWKEADLAASTAATGGPAASSQNSPQFVMHLIKGGKARPGGFNDLSVVVRPPWRSGSAASQGRQG